MSKAVDDPANNGPIVTEALMYLRGDNPAYSGLDRQVDAIGQARDMWGRVNDGVRANLDGITEPGPRQQLTAYADGLSGAYSPERGWWPPPRCAPPPRSSTVALRWGAYCSTASTTSTCCPTSATGARTKRATRPGRRTEPFPDGDGGKAGDGARIDCAALGSGDLRGRR
ncbi:Uncharacterised protein [Mycobacteroides abscessus subsp. massiliense]|nr:Uncharacterised protein [Mycobacteroides abscessus subsp. massiliense]